LPLETNDKEEENQEHLDPAHGIWTQTSGISPQHNNKTARPTTSGGPMILVEGMPHIFFWLGIKNDVS
jgi:hypothetical protein